MIQGIEIYSLRQISDQRGKIMHMMRCDDPYFNKFGEIYFSMVYPGVIKAWHLHKLMTLNYTVVTGMIQLVLYDDRKNSPTQGKFMEIFMGESNHQLVKVPPGIWNGFKGMGIKEAYVANCATEPHDPQEIVRKDPFTKDIPYDWSLRHG